MPGILGDSEASFRAASLRKPRVLSALAAIVVPTCAFFFYAIQWHGLLPFHLFPIAPIIAASYFAVMLPLAMYVSYESQFQELHPLVQYPALARRCFRALAENNLKVAGKDI